MTQMIRSMARWLFAGKVLRRRFPREFGGGRIFVSTECGGLKYLRRDLRKVDPWLFQMVDEFVQPGATVWDVGANLGLFTFAAANRAGQHGRVVAFEPDVDNLALLQRTRRAMPGGSGRVDIVPVAIGDGSSRFARFRICATARARNTITTGQEMGTLEERWVPLAKIDDLLDTFGAPSFMKMDIEGAEALALSGAGDLLSRVRPTLVVEVEQANLQAVGSILKSHRYRLFDAEAPRASRTEIELPSWNCLAVPA